MALKQQKAKKMLKAVPLDRICWKTDASDALRKAGLDSLPSTTDCSHSSGLLATGGSSSTNSRGSESLSESLDHLANIHVVLRYIASLLEMSAEELAELSYTNAVRVFSFEGCKLLNPQFHSQVMVMHYALLNLPVFSLSKTSRVAHRVCNLT